MAKEFAKSLYKSNAWRKCRESYIKSVNGLCERCLEKDKIVPGYIVHHKIELTKYNIINPDISLNHNNLEYLCLDCHNEHHNNFNRKTKKATREGFKFNENGELVPTAPL